MNMHTPTASGDPVHSPLIYPVRNFLDLSTGHLSVDTRRMLDLLCQEQERGDLASWASCTAFGWLVYADEEAKAGDYPDDLLACMRKAEELGCNYILFDRDAAPAGASLDLPFYEECDSDSATSYCRS